MRTRTFATLALMAGIAAIPALAGAASALPADIIAAREQNAPKPISHARSIAKVEGTQTLPGTPTASTYRAYPPSCAADPLPNKPTLPNNSTIMQFWARKLSDLNHAYLENVTVTVWRVPCSSSGAATRYNADGSKNAITLLRIDRTSANEGHEDIYPTFPILQIKQGAIDFTIVSGSITVRNPKSFPRAPAEPNTVREGANYDNSIIDSTTFVLENVADPDAGYFAFNDAFTLRIDPNVPGVITPVDLAIPAYEPTQATFPSAFEPRPLDGYAAAQWINTTLNQGLLVQITEQAQPSGPPQRQLVFDLLTEDLNGDPLWLVGNTTFAAGAKTLTVNTSYLGNGLAQLPWGTATFSIEDCNHLDVTFAANNGLPNPIPGFNGLTVYERLFTPNGMTCE